MKVPRYSVILILLLISTLLNAQWTTQTNVNTLVSTASAEDFKSIGTIEGKTWVVFWKLMPAPVNYQLWVQLLDANGDTVFGPEGLALNTAVPMSTYTTIWDVAVDGSENLYVAINGTGSGNPVYAHKITTSGSKPWGTNGLLVGSGYDPKILPLTNGEVIVSWLPGNQAQFQKIDTSGTLAWTSPKTVPPGVPGHSCTAGELKALSGGGFLIFIHDRSGFGISSQFYAMRYDNAGLPQWTVPKALASSYTSYNARYDVVMDYDTAYLGYYASIGLVFYSYLQRLNPDGTTPWGINGSDFATQSTNYEMNTSIAYEPGSPYVWAICRFTPSSQGQSGEYVQKFDKKTGARLLGANAKQVFAISSNDNAHSGHLQLVNDQPLFLITDGTNNGALPIDLLVTYLDSLGNFAWPQQTMDVGTYVGFKSRIDFLRPYQDQAVAVWGENRGSGPRIYAQNIVPCFPPQAGFGYTAVNLDLWFTSYASNADSLYWDFGDGASSTQTNPVHTYLSTGLYDVCQYVFNACGTDTFCLQINVIATGTEGEGAEPDVLIYPNPGRGEVFVRLPERTQGTVDVKVFSASGQIVRDYSLESRDNAGILRMEGLPPACYFLQSSSGERRIVRKFIVLP